MIYLFYTIVFTTAIYIVFKLLEKFDIDLLQALVINYLTASLLCFFFISKTINFSEIIDIKGKEISFVIGIMFISTFFLYAFSTQKAGIAITAIIGRMSVVIPVFIGFLFFKESMNIFKISGLILALVAFYLSSKKEKTHIKKTERILLLVLIFIGVGAVDSIQGVYQKLYVNSNNDLYRFLFAVYSVALFMGISAILVRSLFFKKKQEKWLKPFIAGLLIGVLNFCATFYFIKGIGATQMSIFIPLLSVSLVILNTLVGIILFKEKFSVTNFAGIILAILAIIFITHS